MHILLWATALIGLGLFSAPSTAESIDESRLERVKTANLLRVCIWPDYQNISYRDPRTQQLSGIDIDLAKELGKDLRVAVLFIDSSFANLIDDVTQDRCDVAMFGVGDTPLRALKLRFTQPYLFSDIYAVTNKSNRAIKGWNDIDKPGAVVAVAKDTLHEAVMKDKLKAAQLLVLDTPLAREQAVRSGRADVFMTDYPFSRQFLSDTRWARLIAPLGTYHVTPHAYAMQLGDDVWHARLERFVTEIKRDGRLVAAAKKHELGPIVAP
jgi:ABC-type amino acid transport substrate-binding protein